MSGRPTAITRPFINPIDMKRSIRVPLERGKLTTVEGAFLTQSYDNGDIGIDDRFDGEIVVTLPN